MVESNPITEICVDIIKKLFLISPAFLLVGFASNGMSGLLVVALGLAAFLFNYSFSAIISSWVSKSSNMMLASSFVGGFFIRSYLIILLLWMAKDFETANLVLLSITIITTHVGLLFLEMFNISTNFTHLGIKPKLATGKPAAGYAKRSK